MCAGAINLFDHELSLIARAHLLSISIGVGVCCRMRGKLIVFAGRIKRAGWWGHAWRGQRAAGLDCQIHLLTMMNHHSNLRPINGLSQ